MASSIFFLAFLNAFSTSSTLLINEEEASFSKINCWRFDVLPAVPSWTNAGDWWTTFIRTFNCPVPMVFTPNLLITGSLKQKLNHTNYIPCKTNSVVRHNRRCSVSTLINTNLTVAQIVKFYFFRIVPVTNRGKFLTLFY